MLTPRQLSDITADVTEVLTNPAATSNERTLARHARYLLDEVERLSETDEDRYNREWLVKRHAEMSDEELSKLDRWTGYKFCDKCSMCLTGSYSHCLSPVKIIDER